MLATSLLRSCVLSSRVKRLSRCQSFVISTRRDLVVPSARSLSCRILCHLPDCVRLAVSVARSTDAHCWRISATVSSWARHRFVMVEAFTPCVASHAVGMFRSIGSGPFGPMYSMLQPGTSFDSFTNLPRPWPHLSPLMPSAFIRRSKDREVDRTCSSCEFNALSAAQVLSSSCFSAEFLIPKP